MNITKIRVTDTDGVEHEWEGDGWLALGNDTLTGRAVCAALTQPPEPVRKPSGWQVCKTCRKYDGGHTPTCQARHGRRCPECVAGKHGNCAKVALDQATDEFVPCECHHAV